MLAERLDIRWFMIGSVQIKLSEENNQKNVTYGTERATYGDKDVFAYFTG